MTPDLTAIIENAYDVFGRYQIGNTLAVCHCNCCMTEDVERELVKIPLPEIPSNLLAEYTNSAHGWDDETIAREMRYFLPRYLELIALNDPPDSMGLDICLRRLKSARWREAWPASETKVLDRFFDAILVANLSRLELARWPVGWRLSFDTTDVLTMIVTAGGDITRALRAWDGGGNAASAIHMAALRERVTYRDGNWALHSAYLEGEYDREADIIGAFLMRPEVDAMIETAFFDVSDPRLQKILSDATTR